jgi:DinB superfamily
MPILTTDLRYPTGKYEARSFSESQKQDWLNDIKQFPSQLENAVINLDASQLHTAYRDGGWTITQVVHHIADSHMNAYCRFKLGITEDNPTIRTYDEKLWAELDDVKHLPINISVTLLFALHARWYESIRHLSDFDWNRTVFHPELQKTITLWYLLGMYSWHGKHHMAHITSLRERNNW